MIKKYELRCCFEYVNKKTWRSMWNRTEDTPIDSAYRQSKEGLLFAVIEGKDIVTRETIRLLECSGQDFCNFQWVAITSMPINGHKGIAKINGKNIGLIMVTRYENITVLNDGTIYIDKRNNYEDKLMHYGKEF